MLKDLDFNKATKIEMAVAKTPNQEGESTFYLYLINKNSFALRNVLISTEAFEHEDGSGRKTSKLRHFIEELGPGSEQKIETVDPSVFGFFNHFWLSYYYEEKMFDKKFVLKPFKEFEIEDIASLGLKGKLAQWKK